MPSIYIVDESELRELQAAAKQRVDALEKAAKEADDEYRPEEAAITRRRLELWRGGHGDGLLDRIDDQMSLYEPAFTDNGKVPDGQQEMFDGRPREEEPEPAQEEEPPQVPLAAGVDQETLEKQEYTLIHAAATGEEFKFCVEHAHTEALERALAVIEGLEGNVGREKAIRRQLKVRAGEPGAEYDLTEARLEALKILARADGAILSARVTDPDGPTVNWIACNYLEAQGLAEEPSKGRWTITDAGRELAAKLSLLEDEQEAEAAAAAAETEAAEEAVAISSTSELLPF